MFYSMMMVKASVLLNDD